MNNTDRHPECHMRTPLGNCNPIGGFCTSVDESICEALHKVSRPQGEWINLHNGKWKCPECGIEVLVYAKGNFCPNCGCRMKGADNDNSEV